MCAMTFSTKLNIFEVDAKDITINPLASIGRTGTSNDKVKVKVMVICLNISFMT